MQIARWHETGKMSPQIQLNHCNVSYIQLFIYKNTFEYLKTPHIPQTREGHWMPPPLDCTLAYLTRQGCALLKPEQERFFNLSLGSFE
jgi:hypothetical protein